MKPINPIVDRWLENLALYATVILAAGAIAGLIGTLGGEHVIDESQGAIVIHHDPETGETEVEQTGRDFEPGLLFIYTLGALYIGTVYVLPVLLVALAVTEVLIRAGVPARGFRIAALIVALLLAMSALSNDDSGYVVISVLAMFTFIVLVRLPERHIGTEPTAQA